MSTNRYGLRRFASSESTCIFNSDIRISAASEIHYDVGVDASGEEC